MEQTRRKAAGVVALSALMIALLAAGCGDSGGSGSSGPPLKKPQFVQQANSICEQASTEMSAALTDAGDGEPELDELTEAALPPLEQMAEELGELGPPKGDEEQVEAIVEAFEEGLDEVEENSSDPSVQISAFAEANGLAQAYGLTDCAI